VVDRPSSDPVHLLRRIHCPGALGSPQRGVDRRRKAPALENDRPGPSRDRGSDLPLFEGLPIHISISQARRRTNYSLVHLPSADQSNCAGYPSAEHCGYQRSSGGEQYFHGLTNENSVILSAWVVKSRVRNFVPLKSGPILPSKRTKYRQQELAKRVGIKRVALMLA
jgi:hypothetical protein